MLSFILKHFFILVMNAMNPFPIPETLDFSLEYTLDGHSIAGHNTHTFTHAFASRGN